MKSNYFLSLLLFFALQSVCSQYEISGKLSNYSKLWHNKVYLSYIEPTEHHNQASTKQIVNSATLDEDGNFVLKGNNLPSGKSLVRLYLVKNEKITVMLSNRPRNYILLVVNDTSKVHINAKNYSTFPLDYTISGNFQEENNKIKELESELYALSDKKANPYIKSEKGKKILREKRNQSIKKFCLSNSFPLPNIIAAQKLDIASDYVNDLGFYKGLLKKITKNNIDNSSYVAAFSEEIDIVECKNSKTKGFGLKDIIITALSALLLVLLIFIIRLKKKINDLSTFVNNSSPETLSLLLEMLTRREKEIIELIKQDYQNKEIANRLHLEVSTVKSHLSKIYTKLNVKNRNELKSLLK